MCVCVCVRARTHGTKVEGAGSGVREGCVGREIHPVVSSGTHTLTHTHTFFIITVFLRTHSLYAGFKHRLRKEFG